MNKKVEQNQNPGLTFSVAELLRKSQGATDEYTLNAEVSFDKNEIETKGKLKGKVKIMNIEKAVNVQVKDVEIKVVFTCSKCLEKFTETIRIPFAERQFDFAEKEGLKDEFDSFYVNMKSYTLNIEELLRQEIILHFPLVPVCSTHNV